ncbi:hypothetical protein HF877_00310 [Rhodococcus sp. BL-253-APC-6A1W]|uniref:hypothetical protein n=1 Tax=Rhodococcus sp. BL-253-APC-6A1W TaxID=2725307 RepID=UPI00146D3814|nr:hypothetical protein [Rhodococcus sp. BL-253-APC-6A1W]NMD93849.1 hypothetical protein [Rhodococcus sp. BL-253-APC-6A1W]
MAVMLPPPFLAFAHGLPDGRRAIFDVHSGLITDRRWRPFLAFTLAAFRTDDILLAHNEVDAEILRSRVSSNIVILQDPALTAAAMRDKRRTVQPQKTRTERAVPLVLFPSSGDSDEPLELFAAVGAGLAARKHAEVVVTGRRAKSTITTELICTPGFLPQEDYDQLMESADIVVALSTRPNIIQRAAFEAVLVGARPVVAESIPLRRILGEFAEYVDPASESSVLGGIDRAIGRGRPTEVELKSIRGKIACQEKEQISAVRELL